MADRAEIRVTLDARQAKGEAQRARRRLLDNERRVKEQLRAERQREATQARQLRGLTAAGRGARGGLLGLGGAVIGVGVGQVAGLKPVAKALGTAATALAAFEAVTEVGVLGAEVTAAVIIRPIVSAMVEELLSSFPGFPPAARAAITGVIELKVKENFAREFDRIRRVARFEAITKQVARAEVIDVAATFARAGQGFTIGEGIGLSENFVRQTERRNFLRRQETNRTTSALTKEFIDAIKSAMGE